MLRTENSVFKNALISIFLVGLVALSWSTWVDDRADEVTVDNLKQALAVLALARTFNGVISVAQGTEVAIQPVGVGVTLTLGEVLDPLNDLVEQFSALALMASVSLGLQLTLGKIMASPVLSGLMTAVIVIYLAFLWLSTRSSQKTIQALNKVLGFAIFVRFFLAVVLMTTYWVDTYFLQDIQEQAVAELTLTSDSIKQINEQAVPSSEEEQGFFSNFLDSSRQSLDIKGQLESVQQKAESSVEEIINLIVVFLLQTLLIPIATLYTCGWLLRRYWQFVTNSS